MGTNCFPILKAGAKREQEISFFVSAIFQRFFVTNKLLRFTKILRSFCRNSETAELTPLV